LAAFGDPAMGQETLEGLALHLDSCPACRARLEELEPVLTQLSRCLDEVHAHVPRSPLDKASLQSRMKLSEINGKRRFTPTQFAWAGGIAASIVGFAIFLSLSGDASELRAENLLVQASAAPAGRSAGNRLRIRTQKVSFIRPLTLAGAIREDGEAALVRAHFTEAHYDWRDPLSASSYADWRHSLKHKTSKVVTGGETTSPQQKIETTTEEGALRAASLTFDAKLAPVSGLFQFSDQEWVEITAVPDAATNSVADVVPAPVPAPAAAGTTENVPREPLAERELNVLAAINVLHTSASEPIEVSTGSGDILVTTYHLSAEQEKKLAASLAGISGVTLRAANTTAEQKQPAGRIADRGELILQTSENCSFEAHQLANLADRFPLAAEATLTDAWKSKLWNLRLSHVRELNRHVAKLQQELKDESSDFRPPSGDADASSTDVQGLVNSASAMGRLVITLYASDGPASDRATLWPQISSEFARLRMLAKNYSRTIEEQRRVQK